MLSNIFIKTRICYLNTNYYIHSDFLITQLPILCNVQLFPVLTFFAKLLLYRELYTCHQPCIQYSPSLSTNPQPSFIPATTHAYNIHHLSLRTLNQALYLPPAMHTVFTISLDEPSTKLYTCHQPCIQYSPSLSTNPQPSD